MNKETLELPSDISVANKGLWPRDLAIVSLPKMGKGTILGDFTTKRNAVVLDLEKGGYEYISARKLSTYSSQEATRWDSYVNYTKYRRLLLDNKGKYEFLIIDGISDLDDLSDIGGTIMYMNSIIGKKFNRKGNTPDGERLEYGDPEWKSVLTLPDGAGYQHTRNWFVQQIELFRQISPYRIYAAHVADKYINDKGREEVIGAEIAITGKLKTIFAAKMTALCKMVADGNKRYLNFEVMNDSIIAGSRAPHLKGSILISEMTKEGVVTFWENIYG